MLGAWIYRECLGGLRKCLEEHYKSPNGKNDTGAEPSPAYFNIIMHGEEEEVLDGTQLAADWTFSGLQKFGQGLLDRLRGLRFNNKLLEKVSDYKWLSIYKFIAISAIYIDK